MAEYRTIQTRVWEDDWFVSLSAQGKVLWFYLLTNHRASVAGIYQISERIMSFETGIPADQIGELLRGFEAAGKIMYADGVLWVKRLRDYQQSNSPKVLQRIRTDVAEIRAGAVKTAYSTQYGYPIDTVSDADEPVSIPYPHARDEQEREKEQETETETDTETRERARAETCGAKLARLLGCAVTPNGFQKLRMWTGRYGEDLVHEALNLALAEQPPPVKPWFYLEDKLFELTGQAQAQSSRNGGDRRNGKGSRDDDDPRGPYGL